MMKKFFIIVFAAICFVALTSISKADVEVTNLERGEVVVYNWSEYIPPKVINQFLLDTGIRVVYSTFESNEAMYAKIKLLGGKGYDVVVPSTYFVELMAQQKMIIPLDMSKIPNLSNLETSRLGLTEFHNKYSVPYMWGVSGLAYNSKFIKPEQVQKWADLLRPEFKGKIVLFDDIRDAFNIGLKVNGFSANSTDPKEIEKAYQFLQQLKQSVKVFSTESIKQSLITEEVWLGPIWSDNFNVAKEENPDLEFVLPEEGVTIWIDSFAIPKGVANIENAYKFINYMLRPDVAAQCIEEFMSASPNTKAIKLLDQALQNNPIITLSADYLTNAELQTDVGPALQIYEKYWEKLKTQ